MKFRGFLKCELFEKVPQIYGRTAILFKKNLDEGELMVEALDLKDHLLPLLGVSFVAPTSDTCINQNLSFAGGRSEGDKISLKHQMLALIQESKRSPTYPCFAYPRHPLSAPNERNSEP